MGALIRTVGTRMLIEHFNHEFRGSRLNDIRTQHPQAGSDPRNQLIQEYFKTDKDLKWLSDTIKHAHSTHAQKKCFLPPKHKDKASPNAIARWTWFIDKANISGLDALTAPNHVDLCNAIYTGLTGACSSGGLYDRIEFDAVDGTSVKGGGPDQFVLQAEEPDPNGAKYYKIVLVTPPIPSAAAGGRPKKDDQPGDP